MRTSFGPVLGLALMLVSTPALADEGAAEDAPAVTVSGGATVVSDYRFRGLSQTNRRPAVQGTITVAHESGIYGSVWGSSIDDYVAAGGDQEIDLSLGYKHAFGDTTVDVGALYYYYPGAEAIIPGYNSDFIEPYASITHSFGAVSAKVYAAYAPSQSALDYGFGKENNFYASFDLSGTIPDTPVSLTAHVGRNFTRSFLSGGLKYTDWSIGASFTHKALTFGLAYVDTSANLFSGLPNANRNIGRGGIVASLGAAF